MREMFVVRGINGYILVFGAVITVGIRVSGSCAVLSEGPHLPHTMLSTWVSTLSSGGTTGGTFTCHIYIRVMGWLLNRVKWSIK